MKRSEALAILSRDHHQALFVASKLTRAELQTAGAERQRFLEFWEDEGSLHFRLEEEVLLPAYAKYGDARHPLALRTLGDHVELRMRIERLRSQPEATPEQLHELGADFAAHVRVEERELFALIEAAMPADELLALALVLDRAEQTERVESLHSGAG